MEIRMNDEREKRSDVRHERLAAIVAEYACSIQDDLTKLGFLAADTPRYAAATSLEPPDPDRRSGGVKLLLADTSSALADLLDRECRRGRRAYGRTWDLDAPDGPPRTLGVADFMMDTSCRDGSIYRVTVAGREEGTYFFDHPHDAEDFWRVVRDQGGLAEWDEEPIHDRLAADALIGVEAGR
jgi:hypothetical protein